MIELILALVVFSAGIFFVVFGKTNRTLPKLIGVGLGVLGLVIVFFSTFYQVSVGEARVAVNAISREVEGDPIVGPAVGFVAPWTDFIDFDLFSQQVTYAGSSSDAPVYTGGMVSGQEITIAVGGVAGGSTQGNMDATVVYNIDGAATKTVYTEFKSQERFTQQIVEKRILSTLRQVPSNYSAVEFRGTKRPDAEQKILAQLNQQLDSYGVEVTTVTIQDVRYPVEVEAALKDVEVANQKQQTAEANQRAAKVDAQTKVEVAKLEAQAAVAKAKGEAEAAEVLTKALTPQVLQQRYIDALGEAGRSGSLVVVDGSDTPVLISPGK